MSEHLLPNDYSRWPDDPFALLGVARGVSERDLRRAYARLIRIYKPEQFPEQFRRIREAYETARHYAPFFFPGESPPETSAAPAEPPAPEIDDPAPVHREHPAARPQPRSLADELDEAWSWAVAGDETRAYANLLTLYNLYPHNSTIRLRLYGLLSVAPELAPRRLPCDFLVEGLLLADGTGPGHELYRQEIEDHPEEALSDRFARLLARTSQPGLLATFVGWRWHAAGRLGRCAVIGDDLPGLRARLAAVQEQIWLSLLSSAADQLAWTAATGTSLGLVDCLHEVAQLTHLQLRCPDVFDRLEYLEQVAAGWHALKAKGTVPAELLELLRRYWTRPFAEVRRRLMDLLAAVSAAPEVWLGHLVCIHEVSPPLLSLFGKVLDSYQWTLDLEDDRDPEDLMVLARDFLEDHGSLRYRVLRARLLTFCLREWIDPEVAAQLAVSQAVILYEKTRDTLANDWPLRLVYRACKLFRA